VPIEKRDPIDWKRVASIWRASGRTPATIHQYQCWARHYLAACLKRGHSLRESLTETSARRFFVAAVRKGDTSPTAAVRALSCALVVLGWDLPAWRSPSPEQSRSPLVEEFVAYRVAHRGVAPKSARFDADVASAFLRFLKRRRRQVGHVRLPDVDAFVEMRSRTWAPRSTAALCSTLRAFLAFLCATGRCRADLAALVVSPRVRRVDRPPRALPWVDVQRILRAIDVRRGLGPRDFAMFLMMATYGMGAGEITALVLDDVDWVGRTFRVRRLKTGTITHLPLLGPVARALARYLRHHRPPHARARAVFVSHRMPHGKLSGASAIKHRLVMYAERAGVHADFMGTHVFRHTHATRQIEAGAPAKIVGDILGHRRPESTSVYVRGALAGLRSVALPVPR
jgi:site-specific recombinase XerD